MQKYTGLNYEMETHCFDKTKKVKTTLRYGTPQIIPNPWLTVFIPTYKRVALLKQAIESVLNQWHTDFLWDLVIIDNEPDDGKMNETERLVRKFNNPRILYYRNSENMRPADNFNRGLITARGEWVCFLHDDDLLIANTLQKIGKLIQALQGAGAKPLGAISAKYYQFAYDPETQASNVDLAGLNYYFTNCGIDYYLYKLTHTNIWMTSHIGGDVPSNGATYCRKIAIESGGFNDDFGISGDLILYYRMERISDVYSTTTPIGFYRWGSNTMVKKESTRETIQDGFAFREYVYSRNVFSRLLGAVLRSAHYYEFTKAVVDARNIVSEEQISLSDYDDIYNSNVSKLSYSFFRAIRRIYFKYKGYQSNRLRRKLIRNSCR